MSGAPQFVLASASPRRRDLLVQIGRRPGLILDPDIDETPGKDERPEAHAARLAYEKAEIVARRDETAGAVVLGADTVVACGRRILPKAEDETTARRCLGLLSGRRHRVIGAVCVIAPGGMVMTRSCTTQVAFKRLAAAETDAYIATGEWRGKAGGYAIQGRAAVFVRFIRGSYSNVVGLPLFETERLLDAAGLPAQSGSAPS